MPVPLLSNESSVRVLIEVVFVVKSVCRNPPVWGRSVGFYDSIRSIRSIRSISMIRHDSAWSHLPTNVGVFLAFTAWVSPRILHVLCASCQPSRLKSPLLGRGNSHRAPPGAGRRWVARDGGWHLAESGVCWVFQYIFELIFQYLSGSCSFRDWYNAPMICCPLPCWGDLWSLRADENGPGWVLSSSATWKES